MPPGGGGRVWNSASPSGNPQLELLAGLAAELSGDVAWSMWVSAQAKLGHPCHAIEQALDVCVNTGKWSRNLAAGVLRRLASEGYPEPRDAQRQNPRVRVQVASQGLQDYPRTLTMEHST